MRRLSLHPISLIAATLLVGALVACRPKPPLAVFAYDTLTDPLSVVGPWQSEQEPQLPANSGNSGRISNVATPGSTSDSAFPRGHSRVMRVEVRAGDDTDTGGYHAPRAEVIGRSAASYNAPPPDWPDHAGTIRWYRFAVYVPADNPRPGASSWWTVVTQWKGRYGGSPPDALEINADHFEFVHRPSNISSTQIRTNIADLAPGHWTVFEFGFKWSTTDTGPDAGWSEVWVNNVNVIPRETRATMHLQSDLNPQPGQPDPIYFKQGIYRSSLWNATQVLYFGPVTIADSRASVIG